MTLVPPEVLLAGAVLGLLYGVVAVGVVLVHRAQRLVNLAQAQLGAAPAVLVLLLVSEGHVPYLAGVLLAVALAAAIGALSELLVIRRFVSAPPIVALVATVGLAQLLVWVEVALPGWVGLDGAAPAVTTPFAGFSVQLGVARFTGDHVFAVVACVALLAALWFLLQRTRIGLVMRASADRRTGAAQLGLPVGRAAVVVWAVAGACSALGALLRIPMVGFPVGGLVGPSLLLYALAAAVVARLQSLPVALAAGVGVGMVEQASIFSTGRSSAADAAMLVVIVVALVLQRRRTGRLHEGPGVVWLAVRDGAWLPALARDRDLQRARALALAAVALVALAVPQVLAPGDVSRFNLLVLDAAIAVSLVVLTGWAGQISLGQYALAGLGGAVAGSLATSAGGSLASDWFVTLLLAGAVGAAVAMAVGVPAIRLPGPLLAVTSLALAFAVSSYVLDPQRFPQLAPDGPVVPPVLFERFDITAPASFAYICLGWLALVLLLARNFRRSRTGRLVISVRDDPRVAATFGVAVLPAKLVAFALSGAVSGVTGALLVYEQGALDASTFAPARSIALLAVVVIGGATSPLGAVLATGLVLGLPAFFPGVPALAALTSAAGLLGVLLVRPGGLADLVRSATVWAWTRRQSPTQPAPATQPPVAAQAVPSAP